ncbi:hypothetical protein [Streptomyces chartreusis]|uniref:hypothetical protein n=1 Tax=Streptomyces chartreusis TaxID=1969 RepID=UPI0033D1705C
MNTKVWRNTRSNALLFHAFPEGKGLCNARIKPNEGDYVTADAAKAQPMTHLCERCEFRMAHLARKAAAEANPIQTLIPAEAATLADAQGRVMFMGSAKEYKRPQANYPTLVRIERQGAYWALIGEDGTTEKRVRGEHPLWVRRVPEGYDDARAQVAAQVDAMEITLVEVAAPVAKAERVGEPAHVADEDQDQDVTVTAQDVADAELGACEWTDEQIEDAAQAEAEAVKAAEAFTAEAAQGARYAVGQTVEYTRGGDIPASIPNGRVEVTRVVDHGPEAAYREGGRFTYVVRVPGIPQATQGASQDELSAIEGAPQLDPQAVTEAQEAAYREAEARDVEREAEALEDARQRLEALRAPEVEAEVAHAGTHRNVSYMITMAPNEKARASWQRVALASWFAAQVKAHAQANGANGWDVVTETISDGELNVMMLEALRGGMQSTEEAISYVRSLMVEPYRERTADALISAWGGALEITSDGKAEVVKVTDAMVREIEKATVFEHGTEIGGHAAMLRAMERQGLIRQHGAGGTLTDRGMWLRGYLMAGGTGREFLADEMHD